MRALLLALGPALITSGVAAGVTYLRYRRPSSSKADRAGAAARRVFLWALGIIAGAVFLIWVLAVGLQVLENLL